MSRAHFPVPVTHIAICFFTEQPRQLEAASAAHSNCLTRPWCMRGPSTAHRSVCMGVPWTHGARFLTPKAASMLPRSPLPQEPKPEQEARPSYSSTCASYFSGLSRLCAVRDESATTLSCCALCASPMSPLPIEPVLLTCISCSYFLHLGPAAYKSQALNPSYLACRSTVSTSGGATGATSEHCCSPPPATILHPWCNSLASGPRV